MRFLRKLAILFVLLVGAALGFYLYLHNQLQSPHSAGASPVIVEIPKGSHTREVVHLLHEKNIIGSENVMLALLVLTGNRGRLQAGEYLFDHAMSPKEVIDKLANGRVYLATFSNKLVVYGLR